MAKSSDDKRAVAAKADKGKRSKAPKRPRAPSYFLRRMLGWAALFYWCLWLSGEIPQSDEATLAAECLSPFVYLLTAGLLALPFKRSPALRRPNGEASAGRMLTLAAAMAGVVGLMLRQEEESVRAIGLYLSVCLLLAFGLAMIEQWSELTPQERGLAAEAEFVDAASVGHSV